MSSSPALEDEPQLIHPRPVFSIGRVVSAIVVVILALMLLNGLVYNPNFHWELVWEYLFHPNVIQGIWYTLALTIISMLIGVILAVAMAIMRQSVNPITRWVAWFYIWFFRGTPIYTQLIFWGLLGSLYSHLSFGIPFGPALFTWPTDEIFTPLVAACAGLGLNEGAYLAEIVRSGLNSVDPGQSEAATALGMKRSRIMRRIIIPQAMRVIVPPTGNQAISMLKTTSLVVAVPFTLEITFATQTLGQQTLMPIPLLIVAASWYLLITSILMVGQSYVERYFGRGFDEARPKKKKKAPSRTAAIAAADTTKPSPFLGIETMAAHLTGRKGAIS